MRAICPKCTGSHVRKKGVIYSKSYECSVQRWVCLSCGKNFQVPIDSPKVNLPKILLFDIETSLMEVYVWGLYKQFIPHTNIIKDKNGEEKTWYVLSWAAKWLYDENIISDMTVARAGLTDKIAIGELDVKIQEAVNELKQKFDYIFTLFYSVGYLCLYPYRKLIH